MGDCANIVVNEQYGGKRELYLFARLDGRKLPEVLARALARGTSKWGEADYLTRIVFSEMIADDIEGAGSYAISFEPKGWDLPHLVLNVDDQQVSTFDPENDSNPVGGKWSFGEFAACHWEWGRDGKTLRATAPVGA